MSTTMINIGYIGVLATPLDHEENHERLEAAGLGLNYDGTLVYTRETNEESCEFDGLRVMHPEEGKHKLLVSAAKAGVSIEAMWVKPYFCHWYNGSDSPLDTLTKSEFLEE